MIRHLDLFAGIGGFARAAHWTGKIVPAGFVEIDAECRRDLASHWPGVPFHDDIKTLTADVLRRWAVAAGIEEGFGIDLITGGYPCQPFSLAGQRRGAQDDRHLWPEMRRVIDLVRPRYILAENVVGHVSMGLDVVLAELETDGYAVRPVVVPAGAVNAWHRRDRVWIMAHATSDIRRAPGDGERTSPDGTGAGEPVPDAAGWRQQAWFVDDETRQPDVEGRGDLGSVPDADRGGHGRTTYAIRARRNTVAAGGAPRSVPDADDARLEGHRRQHGLRDAGDEVEADRRRHDAAVPDAECRRQPGSRQPRHADNPATHRVGQAGHVVDDDHRHEGIQAARPVDARPDGIRARLVRSPGARSARHPGTSRHRRPAIVSHYRPAAGIPATAPDPVAGPEGGLVAPGAVGDAPGIWNHPEAIREAWADGSWEHELPRVIQSETRRNHKLKAAGNAIVPLVAYMILSAMIEDE